MSSSTRTSMTRTAALIASIGFGGMFLFQLLLALGLPLGRFAWGGEAQVLPMNLRVGSAVSAGIFLLAIPFVLERAGVIRGLGKPRLAGAGSWALVVLFGLSALLNFFQGGEAEMKVMIPVALSLSLLSLVVATGPRGLDP